MLDTAEDLEILLCDTHQLSFSELLVQALPESVTAQGLGLCQHACERGWSGKQHKAQKALKMNASNQHIIWWESIKSLKHT